MVGALDSIAVDAARGALAAKIVVDHIGIEKAAGIEAIFSGSTMDEVARMIRLQLADQLPPIQIPVKVQQSIELPAVTNGPVRIDGASMPIAANVSRVFAGQGRLWVAIHFQPGELVKTQDAPEAQDSRAEDVDAGFDAAAPGQAATRKPGKAKAEKPSRRGSGHEREARAQPWCWPRRAGPRVRTRRPHDARRAPRADRGARERAQRAARQARRADAGRPAARGHADACRCAWASPRRWRAS